MIRIVHLSDVHLDASLLSITQLTVEPLLKDLVAFHEDHPITAIVCSGDLIDRGGVGFDSADDAFNAFAERVADPLLEGIGLDRSQFVITPGNHDVVRSADSEWIDSGLKGKLTNRQKLEELFSEGTNEGMKRMDAYRAFVERFYEGVSQPIHSDGQHTCYTYEVDGVSLGIASLNTAWRCYGSDEEDAGYLMIGEQVVARAVDTIKHCDYKVAVHHHPLRYLAEFDRDLVEPVIEQEFCAALTGHVHQSDAVSTDRVSGLLFVSTAPGAMRENALDKNSKYTNGYRIIDIVPDEGQLVSHDRIYVFSKKAFAAAPNAKEKEGRSVYRLPTTVEMERRQHERAVVQTIGAQTEEVLNEHLVTYGTDTCAPKTVRELFVAPEIIYRNHEGEEELGEMGEQTVTETSVTIDDLLDRSENLLLCGAKESGKTVLLDRLLARMVDEVTDRRKIPVRIEWDKLGNRRFETEVNAKTSVGSSEVKTLCTDHDVVLLIDDLDFNEDDTAALQRLKDFVTRYPRVRLIATHLQRNSGEIPMGMLAHNDSLNLLPLDIRTFGIRQIRSLVVRWFSGSKGTDMAKDIDRIVMLFQTLNLPSNPLAISIFLWMIEKQERYEPTNGSTMMENFVERLFEKHSAKEALSGRFDSHNKQRLLAEVAHFMYTEDGLDYQVDHMELLSRIDRTLKAKKFTFDARVILDRFIDMGLFSVHGPMIQFRFRCFFEYFLAKQMEYEKDFEEYIIENELLTFSSEIKYLTGLQRDRTDILETVLDQMEAEFRDTRARLKSIGTYDDAFNTARSFLGEEDAERILGSIEESRPTDAELDADQDARLEAVSSVQGIARKQAPASLFVRLGKSLGLAAGVLKNTEETTEEGLKGRAYRRIIDCALVYTVLYKREIMVYLEENEDTMPEAFKPIMNWVSDFTPILMQITLHDDLSTPKLSAVFRDEVERSMGSEEATDIERFFAVFMYADSRGDDYVKYIRDFIYTLRKRYMESNVMIKIVSYFYMRANTKDMDDKMLDLLGDLIVKSQGLPSSAKGRIMGRHRQAKTKLKARVDHSQVSLDI